MNLKRIVAWLVPTVVVLAATVMTLRLGPDVESRMFPVIDNFKIESILRNKESGDLVLMGSFTKLRDCKRHALVATIINDDESDPEKTRIVILDNSAKIQLTKGTHEFGPWVVSFNKKSGDWLKLDIVYTCHQFYYTESPLAKIKLDSIKEFK